MKRTKHLFFCEEKPFLGCARDQNLNSHYKNKLKELLMGKIWWEVYWDSQTLAIWFRSSSVFTT
jgi:hypothetical protein